VVHRQSLILLVVVSALIAIFLLIYKQTCVTRLLYEQQLHEKEKTELEAHAAQLEQQLLRLNDATAIRTYTTNTLGMKKVRLAQVSRIGKKQAHQKEPA